ncbi:SDR family oxidoreductase [Pseudonocardia sp. KRD-184]|uniref:SDR family oxidoreductase n=1 Tax=Pseudonocardia oceani TaxID=2792013 RepID=A0ABS6U490_9PSEU|nr:SDR family oxidoreductase [Pseudonocardia oceani]MBW0089863.1 SDR family oxidoreductase [Pseudonocardia oceani]MBW0097445.1 SDR family oxidoreductase [Pseudonocardia oceani]MBW0123775.1 SDR family oxidoreductase [Pseudonocardia oceani]MBW0127060.1 SDR family oxidoreductase [Pseudonocardia oceani]
MGKLEGKVAIVTGGAGGIGAATVRAMVHEGASVVVADYNLAGAQDVVDSLGSDAGRAIAVRVDVGEETQVVEMVEVAVREFGGLDVLHNNAADTGEVYRRDLGLLSMDAEVWDHTMRINLRGPMFGCKHAIPRMLARGGGSIVNTSSASSLSGELVMAAYGASKAGLNSLTRSVATQFGKRGIRCNAVTPGMTLTPGAMENTTAEFREMYVRHFLTPYAGTPEMQADVVVFLASDEARFVTGQIIAVDGGMLSHVPKYGDLMAMDPTEAGPNYAHLFAEIGASTPSTD